MKPIDIAKVCHEANKAYCESLGDLSQKHWNDAEQWQRDSAVLGVKFRLENPEAPPSAQHDSWLAQKNAEGWSYGPIKDPWKKEHPCMVPYDQLPTEQKVKDSLFSAVVGALKPLINRT